MFTRSSASVPRLQAVPSAAGSYFDYFAYGSCMCPVDLQRTIGEPAHPYVVGPATLQDYRLAFSLRSLRCGCGVLDVVSQPGAMVHGVLYRLPWHTSDALDAREQVAEGSYRQATVTVTTVEGHRVDNVRTYMVRNKLSDELAPNDWYFQVVMRGATTCGLPEDYCWQLFHHMHQLQQAQQTRPTHQTQQAA